MENNERNIIFRLQEGSDLSNSIKHWEESVQYQEKQLEAIKSTNPETINEPTSIPSPFARIALAKTAFGAVAKDWEKALKAYQKIVSDCLDVAEIFFNYDKLKDKVQILVWDKDKNLKELVNDIDHQTFGDTLKMFLEQDAKGKDPFNFSRLQRIYMLNYIGPERPSQLSIIGATSPATLFFSAANDLSYVSRHISFGINKAFDNTFKPLYKRDFEFQKYLYVFRLAYGAQKFAAHFPEFDRYLHKEQGGFSNYSYLKETQKPVIDSLNENSNADYQVIKVDKGANVVEILDTQFHCRFLPDIVSDFEIKSEIFFDQRKPLVLPIESGNTYTNLIYTQDLWHKDYKAPIFDNTIWNNRRLPHVGDNHPYLTISDFLMDTMICLPYEINKKSFFNGNLDKSDGKSYLLPLTDLFFVFFKAEDVDKILELKTNAGGVTVKLRIPIKNGNYIEYSRNYFENCAPNVDAFHNDGAIVQNDFVFSLFPNIRFANEIDSIYRFGLLSDFHDSSNYDAKYYSGGIKDSNLIIRNDNNQNYKQCKTYVLQKSNFDYIRINCPNNRSGIVIPVFKKQSGTDQYTFAVDLGTTNTHIEYRIGDNGKIQSFNIGEDKQIHSSSEIVSDNYIFDFDFIPERIGDTDEFKFPIRTALSEAKNLKNWDSVYPLAHANVPFPYEKRDEYKYNRILTGLKWSNESDNIKKIRCYIDSLFLILRNKVILNNGDLKSTKIVWFYPISMTKSRFDNYKKEWEDSYLKHFGSHIENIIPVTESIAPYEFFKNQVTNAGNMVTIDIGGGTSDIVFANNDGVQFITSFRFAANSIFGDGYAKNAINGIIKQFKGKILKTLQDAEMDNLSHIFENLNSNNISSDLASFFFSLKDNKEIVAKNLSNSVDFNKMLMTDETQKIVFILFYVAIIYHLAHIMKAKKLPMPRHIAFSGNGSKVLQVLTADDKLLESFTKLIFEKIFETSFDQDRLTILRNSNNPKEATCKGGIFAPIRQDYENIYKTKVVLKCTNDSTFVNNETYKNAREQDYLDSIVDQAVKYLNFALNLNDEFSYRNNFGISARSLQIARECCFRDLKTFSLNGLTKKLDEASDDDIIEETFFFYPLIGMLTSLSAAILENKNEIPKTRGYKEEELFNN